MIESIRQITIMKKIRKSRFYCRLRQHFPMSEMGYVDDRQRIEDAEVVRIDWPTHLSKPKIGIVRDYGKYPRWTKYVRFFDNNSFHHDIYNIHAHDWVEKARRYDVIVGITSSELCQLEEIRWKYYFLETFLYKTCYPSPSHAMLYEDKNLEACISKGFDVPFLTTYMSNDKKDALRLIENLTYPVVCKIVPSSGSVGTELVGSLKHSRRIVEQAFSRNGRKTHMNYFRQKNYIYFQDYVPNDGYDIRVIVVGSMAFGYYRKALNGDFRASGMCVIEKRALPKEALEIAWNLNKIVNSPMLVVDMLHGLDGKYHVIEFSPICQIETSEQLHVDGVPGAYVFDNGTFRFQKGRYWVHELALREFLLNNYLGRSTIITSKNRSHVVAISGAVPPQ